MSIFKDREEKFTPPKSFLRDKYLDDYENRKVLNPKTGKMRREFVYVGDYYELLEPNNIGKAKCVFSITTLVTSICWIVSLSIPSEIGLCWVIIPDALLTVSVFFQLCAACRTLTIKAGKPLKREDNDKTAPRFKAVGIAGILFGAAAVICHIIYGIINGNVFGDIWHYAVNAGVIASSYFTYKYHDLLLMKVKAE